MEAMLNASDEALLNKHELTSGSFLIGNIILLGREKLQKKKEQLLMPNKRRNKQEIDTQFHAEIWTCIELTI